MAIERPGVALLARSPIAARKSRLTEALDGAGAQALRSALLLDAIDAALEPGWPLHVYLDPPDHVLAVHALMQCDPDLADAADVVQLRPQGHGDALARDARGLARQSHAGPDPGARMADAMTRTLEGGHDAVVLVRSEAPGLPDEVLQDAIDALEGDAAGTRLVLGPSSGGGFYLVASTTPPGSLFDDVQWSSASVLDSVVKRARDAGRDVVLVQAWHDVDTMDDLAHLLAANEDVAPRTRRLVPTLPPYNQRT